MTLLFAPASLIIFFPLCEAKIQRGHFTYFPGHYSDVKGLASTGRRNQRSFSFLKGFDQNLSAHENRVDQHLMERGEEGSPYQSIAAFESQMIITVKKVENNNQ